jgi:quinoprotein glucose dehydrogenase
LQISFFFSLCITLLVAATAGNSKMPPSIQGKANQGKNVGWEVYGGQKEDDHFSTLTQINVSNVHRLRVAWIYDTGEKGELQTNPLIVSGKLYGYTPSQKVIALDATNGKKLWLFDSGIVSGQPDRGLAYWSNGKEKILFASTLHLLWALDPDNGQPIKSFGSNGAIDLSDNLGPESPAGLVAITSPGIIYKDLIILGFRTGETAPAPHGDIRAYDVHTGVLKWSFHTVPHPGEPGYESWPKEAWKHSGAANNWTGMALDERRGIVFVPTGSATTDFYGADRVGNNLYANSLLALDAGTGKLLWHFQAVHHDIWDRDLPSPPTLVTVQRNGKLIDAVAQTTKQGVVFLFDRTNGKPLFPIEERPFPQTNVPGEVSSHTQPMPTKPEPFARQTLTEDLLTDRTPEAHAWALRQFRSFRSEGPFVPFSVDKQTVIFPGFDGGAEWGGSALDPRSSVLYVNANDLAWTGGLVATGSGGHFTALYQSQCGVCHQFDRRGIPGTFPSLVDASQRMTTEQMAKVVTEGRGRMPSFPQIQSSELQGLLKYVRTGSEPTADASAISGRSDKDEPGSRPSSNQEARAAYQFTGYRKFLDPEGYPATAMPWGTLNALDLNTGRYLWKIPFGEYPELVAKGLKATGSENYGGPIVTAGGILVIGATNFDHKIRAFDSRSGRLLWEYTMQYSGNATPATYMVNGKQFIVIATSNGKVKTAPQGAQYVAFALP